jgi:hypothetical protein
MRSTARAAARAFTAGEIQALRPPLARELNRALAPLELRTRGVGDVTPRVPAARRIELAIEEIVEACDGLLAREALIRSLSRDERREILRGMVLTRATDNRLKVFFSGGEVRYGEAAFQGKGFRSLGQEAIYAAAIRLRRGPAFRADGRRLARRRRGAVIRDLGVALAMRADDPSRYGAAGAVGADGKGGSADGGQGPAHRRPRRGACCRPPRH